MKTLEIIIAEDDNWYAEYISHHLSLETKHNITRVSTAAEIFKLLKTKPDLITLDYNLPDLKGDETLTRIKQESKDTEVIIVSAQEDVDTAVQMMNNGAFDYIVKNNEAKYRIIQALSSLQKTSSLKSRINHLQAEVEIKYNISTSIIGQSSALKRVFNYIEKASASLINVSITGETGTGKELVAKAIHFNSNRSKKPFVAVNLSSIPETLIESELFGHVKGAFTGAMSDRKGKFEEANGGTIFLDEIGEISLTTQVKILRVIQERMITQLGSNKVKAIDCRIVCATNKDLSILVQKGQFREDLYYRLIGLPIHLPKLIERDNDILILAKYFVESYCAANQISPILISDEAKIKLNQYKFPGNIRELKTIMELACVMTDTDVISSKDIVFNKRHGIDDIINSSATLKEINEQIILRLLRNNNNNVLLVAEQLKIGKSTIYRLLNEMSTESELN
ncbi:MAG: sigma-54 dependent transcriptional regulator [Flavobacteriaceae bacterium]|nr:sigma-54 dependent transcriptional regulator [Flavobacteriaceae bacterium]